MTREEYREKRIEQKAYLNGYWEDKTYHMGRLDGMLIPSYMYKNRNEPEIVIGCHEMYEQKTTRRSMNIFDKSEKRIELLKHN